VSFISAILLSAAQQEIQSRYLAFRQTTGDYRKRSRCHLSSGLGAILFMAMFLFCISGKEDEELLALRDILREAYVSDA